MPTVGFAPVRPRGRSMPAPRSAPGHRHVPHRVQGGRADGPVSRSVHHSPGKTYRTRTHLGHGALRSGVRRGGRLVQPPPSTVPSSFPFISWCAAPSGRRSARNTTPGAAADTAAERDTLIRAAPARPGVLDAGHSVRHPRRRHRRHRRPPGHLPDRTQPPGRIRRHCHQPARHPVGIRAASDHRNRSPHSPCPSSAPPPPEPSPAAWGSASAPVRAALPADSYGTIAYATIAPAPTPRGLGHDRPLRPATTGLFAVYRHTTGL